MNIQHSCRPSRSVHGCLGVPLLLKLLCSISMSYIAVTPWLCFELNSQKSHGCNLVDEKRFFHVPTIVTHQKKYIIDHYNLWPNYDQFIANIMIIPLLPPKQTSSNWLSKRLSGRDSIEQSSAQSFFSFDDGGRRGIVRNPELKLSKNKSINLT